ncbi:MAG: hydroxyacylglutathione hydrolase [Rhodospirillales bacterium]|nr:hydroxyacylglutathione hydrolase [Rhodospirillales bacterium]
MSRLAIHQVPCLKDNYAYLLRCPETGATAALDPSEAEPVLDAAAAKGWRITHVLNTHHHWDHVGGNGGIKAATGARVIGPEPDRDRIPEIDETVAEGRPFRLGNAEATIFFIPGHTKGHMAFWFPESEALFCGDTLFTLGCGRLFEGTPREMWTSLSKLRALPDEARVYCGHEYTENNARFACAIDPGNAALAKRAEQVRAARAEGRPTVPERMAEERRTNPFLRADDPALAAALGMAGASPVSVFAEIRRRKDNF